MHDYITNSKNRKLKTKILLFLSRVNIGAGKLPLSGRVILLMELILLGSLFFPWIHMVYLDGSIRDLYAFSQFSLYIGYLTLFVLALVPFCLLSHTKKERLRALLPFRLSDTQAIIFAFTILLVSMMNLMVINSIFYTAQIAAQGSTLGGGFRTAFSSIISIFVATYYFSRSNKVANTDMYYLDHQTDDELSKYQNILAGNEENKKKNMSLPI